MRYGTSEEKNRGSGRIRHVSTPHWEPPGSRVSRRSLRQPGPLGAARERGSEAGLWRPRSASRTRSALPRALGTRPGLRSRSVPYFSPTNPPTVSLFSCASGGNTSRFRKIESGMHLPNHKIILKDLRHPLMKKKK